MESRARLGIDDISQLRNVLLIVQPTYGALDRPANLRCGSTWAWMQAVVASLRHRHFRRAYPHPILYHASRRSVSKLAFGAAGEQVRCRARGLRACESTRRPRSSGAARQCRTHCATLRDLDQRTWNERTRALLEDAYLRATTGPGGAGCSRDVKGWEHVRRPLAEAFDRSGTWLDVGCANGYLLETLPAWLIERGITVETFGLELIPTVADLARSRLPHLAERIYTGDVTEWEPPRRWMFVTVLTDAVPPSGLRSLVRRLLDRFVEPGGRLIVSSYGSASRCEPAQPVGDELVELGFTVSGSSQADWLGSGVVVTRSAWIDNATASGGLDSTGD
jgi:hypothetical protein